MGFGVVFEVSFGPEDSVAELVPVLRPVPFVGFARLPVPVPTAPGKVIMPAATSRDATLWIFGPTSEMRYCCTAGGNVRSQAGGEAMRDS